MIGYSPARAGLPVERFDERERLVDRVLAHVADVHQHPALVHRLQRGLAQRMRGLARRLREEPVVDGIGEEGQRGRVGRDPAPEEVRERDVGHAAVGQLVDVRGHLLRRRAEVEAAFDAVHVARGPVVVEVGGRAHDRPAGALTSARRRPSARRAWRSTRSPAGRCRARRGPAPRTGGRARCRPRPRRPARSSSGVTRQLVSQWRKFNARAASASTAARSFPSSRRADPRHLLHDVPRRLHAGEQVHREVDVQVEHRYIVLAPLTVARSRTATSSRTCTAGCASASPR